MAKLPPWSEPLGGAESTPASKNTTLSKADATQIMKNLHCFVADFGDSLPGEKYVESMGNLVRTQNHMAQSYSAPTLAAHYQSLDDDQAPAMVRVRGLWKETLAA